MEGETEAVVAADRGEMTSVYSVWATPPAHVSERLKQLMRNLRAEFGGPEFEPHVTVVGAMRLTEKDAVRKLEAACQGLKPYTARINTVSRGTFFYQCVYLLLDPTPEVKMKTKKKKKKKNQLRCTEIWCMRHLYRPIGACFCRSGVPIGHSYSYRSDFPDHPIRSLLLMVIHKQDFDRVVMTVWSI